VLLGGIRRVLDGLNVVGVRQPSTSFALYFDV
jgi:hypothetical protein